MKISSKNAELVNTVIRKMMTIQSEAEYDKLQEEKDN